MQTDTLSPGARAQLALRLQDARRDLTRANERRNDLVGRADVESALACEPGRGAVRHNTNAVSLRLQAMGMLAEIRDLAARVEMLEGMLAKPAGHAAPVVLTTEQCSAVDDTHNFRAVAA